MPTKRHAEGVYRSVEGESLGIFHRRPRCRQNYKSVSLIAFVERRKSQAQENVWLRVWAAHHTKIGFSRRPRQHRWSASPGRQCGNRDHHESRSRQNASYSPETDRRSFAGYIQPPHHHFDLRASAQLRSRPQLERYWVPSRKRTIDRELHRKERRRLSNASAVIEIDRLIFVTRHPKSKPDPIDSKTSHTFDRDGRWSPANCISSALQSQSAGLPHLACAKFLA